MSEVKKGTAPELTNADLEVVDREGATPLWPSVVVLHRTRAAGRGSLLWQGFTARVRA